MHPLATGFARTTPSPDGKTFRRGSSLVELVVALAVLVIGLLAFSRALTGSLAVGTENRETALATAAAQRVVEQLLAAEPSQTFALHNEDPDDDPAGAGTAPGARFVVAGLDPRPDGDGFHGRILFPSPAGSPAELREDVALGGLASYDLDLDGVIDADDHAADYRALPVVVRIEWQEKLQNRELELATILGVR